MSLGSAFTKQPDFYRECVEAFGDLPGWHVVLQIGKYVDPAELGDVPGERRGALLGAAARDPRAGRRVRHPRGAGRQPGGPGHRHADDRRTAGAWTSSATRTCSQGLGVARHVPAEEATAEALRAAALALVDDPEVARRLKDVQAEMAEEGGHGGRPT